MSAKILNFDDFHPDFANRSEVAPSLGLQVFFAGNYVGMIRLESEILAYSAEWAALGSFADIDAAAHAIIDRGQAQLSRH